MLALMSNLSGILKMRSTAINKLQYSVNASDCMRKSVIPSEKNKVVSQKKILKNDYITQIINGQIPRNLIIKKFNQSDPKMSIEEYSANFNPESQGRESSSIYKEPRVRRNDPDGSWGKWNHQENSQYVMFMDYYQKIFYSRERRRLSRIFKIMSESITTRNAMQCRSHHQKLLGKFGNFKKIIAFFKNQQGSHYQQKFQAYTASLKETSEDSYLVKEEDDSEAKSVMVQTDPVIVMNADQINEFVGLNYFLPQMYSQPTMFSGSCPTY